MVYKKVIVTMAWGLPCGDVSEEWLQSRIEQLLENELGKQLEMIDLHLAPAGTAVVESGYMMSVDLEEFGITNEEEV